MDSNIDLMVRSKLDCFIHYVWISSMKSSSNVCCCNIRHYICIITFFVFAKALSHVAIYSDFMIHILVYVFMTPPVGKMIK